MLETYERKSVYFCCCSFQCLWVQFKSSLLNRVPKSKRVKGKNGETASTGCTPMKMLTRQSKLRVEVTGYHLSNINFCAFVVVCDALHLAGGVLE